MIILSDDNTINNFELFIDSEVEEETRICTCQGLGVMTCNCKDGHDKIPGSKECSGMMNKI